MSKVLTLAILRTTFQHVQTTQPQGTLTVNIRAVDTTRVLAAVAIAFMLLVPAPCSAGSSPQHLLWSPEPVVFPEHMLQSLRYTDRYWSETVYPLGNGRLGCTVFGDPRVERIQFNEDSLWVGNEDYTGGYQPFGDVYVELGHSDYTNYHRELDISRAVQTVKYTSGYFLLKAERRKSCFAALAAISCIFLFCPRNSALPVKWASFAVCNCENPKVLVLVCVHNEIGKAVSEVSSRAIFAERPTFRVFGNGLH